MNKEEQKQILIDMMNQDQKDGLYDIREGLLNFGYDGKFYVYATYYNGIWSDGYELHPNEHRDWMHKKQMGEFNNGGKNVLYKIVHGDGVPYASLDIRSENKTETLGSKLDLILEEIDKIKWMIRDLDSRV
jgi:hypothetical protein